jgi:4-amino-4-deoxy-L-arabinose transferase-like glycosyltransferase
MKIPGLSALLVLNWVLLYPYIGSTGQDFDAVHTYLPMARQLLADGLGYFATEASIHMPPFAYIWPALFGAELGTVKTVNFLLSGATLVLVFRTGWLLHSELAGLAAAALFALCPTTKPFLAAALSEPPYFFLTALWIWSLAEVYVGGSRRLLIITAISLGLASITRGSLFYLLPVLVLFFFLKRERDAAIAHLAALAFPAIFIVKNAILFGFPFFATGSGNALYLGHHPVTGGFDPYYFGIGFDVGSVIQGPDHLSLASERLFTGIARMMVLQDDPAHLAWLYLHKLGAFLFVTNIAAEDHAVWLRAWRIFALIVGAVGFAAVGSSLLRWVLGLMLAYQVAVHLPVLYTMRYSVGALDLWLVLLAGIGIAAMIERRSLAHFGKVALVTTAGLGFGWWHFVRGPEPQLDLTRSRSPLVWEMTRLHGYGLIEAVVPASVQFPTWSNFAIAMDAASGCASIRISYRRDGQQEYSPVVTHRLDDDGRVHHYRWGANAPLEVIAPGRLRIEAPCMMEISRLAIHKLDAGADLRERYLRR